MSHYVDKILTQFVIKKIIACVFINFKTQLQIYYL